MASDEMTFLRRWLSPRALLLHLAVAVVAPGCGIAGWWQATRALRGNGLSWVYSVEWPIFGLIAIAGWWQLIHEDPEALRARKRRSSNDGSATSVQGPTAPPVALGPSRGAAVEPATARLASALAGLVGFEFALGVMTLFAVPFSRPNGWVPVRGEAVYLVHATFGLVVALVAISLVFRTKEAPRINRVVAWLGFSGVALAGAGGLLTEAQALERLFGMALMFVGAVLAGFGYMVPSLLRWSRGRVAGGASAVGLWGQARAESD